MITIINPWFGNGPVPCIMTFNNPVEFTIHNSTTGASEVRRVNTWNFNPSGRGMEIKDNSGNMIMSCTVGNLRITENINKNIIYLPMPVEDEKGGGYGYDIGFTEDTFSLTGVVGHFAAYEILRALVKSNNGETSGTLLLGQTTYKVLLRMASGGGVANGQPITYAVTATIVS